MLHKKKSDWSADLERWGGWRYLLREQSLWSILIYRFGRSVDNKKNGLIKKILLGIYWFFFRLFETILITSIPKEAKIGPGLKIWHFGNIFIHPEVVVGKNCTLRQGVTIGNRTNGGGAPKIGDNVEIGMGAAILGEITIGNNCKIGAMSVVLKDVPDDAIAVGNPARLLFPKN